MTRWARLVSPTLLVFLAASTAHAGLYSSEEVIAGKVYRGERGEEITVVDLKPHGSKGEERALVRFTGTSSPLDNLILDCKHSVDGNHEYYTAEWRGREFSFVQADRRNGQHWELYVVGDLSRARRLVLDEALSKSLKPKALIALHEKQIKDGSLKRVQTFNRAEEQADNDKSWEENVAAVDKACGGHIAARIDWSSVEDAALKRLSIASFCASPLVALSALCAEAPVAAAALRDKVKEVTCRFGAPMKLELASGKLQWSVNSDAANADEFAKKHLEQIEVGEALPVTGAEKPPWEEGRTLGQRIALARTSVCTDGKKHYVVVAPHAERGGSLYYGDGQKLYRVPVAGLLGQGTFFEPRFINPTANSNFRGADVRLFSSVDVDEDKHTCTAQCGTRKTELKILPSSDALAVLSAAAWEAPLDTHVPHALVRDDKGSYYFVDKGATPASEKHFRLFVGPKGNLKLQQMTNVVSDSQGEVFSTKRGELRFIVGPKGSESAWVQGKRRVKLLAVPIEENWGMIYNDLGVYLGERRGTPCDDL